MTPEERLAAFEAYTSVPNFKYNSNGPDHWECPICDCDTCVIYVQAGVREQTPQIKKINHYSDCPHNPINK